MSDHLPDTLMLTLSSHLELGKSRLQTLSWLIIGLINARTVNLSHVASQFAGAAQVSSSYRRLQRFFQHVQLEGDWLAVAVVKLMKIRPPLVLCLDRSNWKIERRDVNILMLAVATRRLRIPLMWTVLDRRVRFAISTSARSSISSMISLSLGSSICRWGPDCLERFVGFGSRL